jgi:hypothetical protein
VGRWPTKVRGFRQFVGRPLGDQNTVNTPTTRVTIKLEGILAAALVDFNLMSASKKSTPCERFVMPIRLTCSAFLLILSIPACVARADVLVKEESFAADQAYIEEHYTKHEYKIPMRDDATLFTAAYVPKDSSRDYPILLQRTP